MKSHRFSMVGLFVSSLLMVGLAHAEDDSSGRPVSAIQFHPETPSVDPATLRILYPDFDDPAKAQSFTDKRLIVSTHSSWVEMAAHHERTMGPLQSAEGGIASSAAPALFVDFPGIIDNQSSIPPDTHGAVGPAHVAELLNTGFVVWNKAGVVVAPQVTLESFWSALGTAACDPADAVFDPKILYDQFAGRWVATSDSNSAQPCSYVLVGISDTSDPTGGWNLFGILADPGGTTWADYPGFGLDDANLYVTNRMFTNAANAFQNAKHWVVSKASMIAGGPLDLATFVPALGGGVFQPAHSFDSSGGAGFNYYVDEGYVVGGTPRKFFKITRFTGIGSAAVMSELGYVEVDGYNFSIADAPQKGCGTPIETNTRRLLNAVMRNGKIWTVQHMGPTAVVDGAATVFEVPVIGWYKIEPTVANVPGPYVFVDDEGRINAKPLGGSYYPSIAVNAEECVAVGFSASDANSYIGAYYTVREASDPPGVTRPPSLLKAGEEPYRKQFGGTRNRWGDYSATVVDPVDDLTFWTIQEYAETQFTPSLSCVLDQSRWGTWWGSFGCENDCEMDKILAADGAAGDRHGYSVAIFGDIAVVGAPFDNSGAGSAYVYRFDSSSGTWLQAPKLVASDATAGANFGISVAVCSDTIVVGAYHADCCGGAYAFVRNDNGTPGDPSDDTWPQQARLRPSVETTLMGFGIAVSCDPDSILQDTIVVGAYLDDEADSNAGAAFVYIPGGNFVWDNGSLDQVAKLRASDGAANDEFGQSVSISGEYLVVGARRHSHSVSGAGSAYAFWRGPNGLWDDGAVDQQAELRANDAFDFDAFGISAAISGDEIIVGSPDDDDGGNSSGSAYVFRRGANNLWDDGSTDQEQKLTAADGQANDGLGNEKTVAISGNTAVVGAWRDDDQGPDSGSGYVFRYNGLAWVQQQKLIASDGAAGDNFGNSVAVSGDVAVVGAQTDDDNGADSGSAYVYALGPDCNANGVADFCDIRDGTSTDLNNDEVPDECSCTTPNPVLATGAACTTNANCNPVTGGEGVCIAGACHTPYNRYLQFNPPVLSGGSTAQAIKVTFTQMPGPSDCVNIPNYSAFQGDSMWVGLPDAGTGVSRLRATPLFQDWGTTLIKVSDCNIVPCAIYTVEVEGNSVGCPSGTYSPGVVLKTPTRFGDVTGTNAAMLTSPDGGQATFIDVGVLVDRFKNLPNVPPGEKPRCDVCKNVPTHGGGTVNIDFGDIGCVLDAFKGLTYDFSVRNATMQHGPAGSSGTCATP